MRNRKLPKQPFHIQKLPKQVYLYYYQHWLIDQIEESSFRKDDSTPTVIVHRVENEKEVYDEWAWVQNPEDVDENGRPWGTWKIRSYANVEETAA